MPPGRWAVVVETPPGRFVTVGIRGPRTALSRLALAPPPALRRLRPDAKDEDGRLPRFVSFESELGSVLELIVVVEATAPVTLLRTSVPTARVDDQGDAATAALALVGLPSPVEPRAGYFLQYPHRYQFVRADVARALRTAFRQVHRRFRGGSFGVGDISQWNGDRPASDLDRPRHISHVGGRDVDLALPAAKGRSLIEPRCRGVMVDERVLRCAPGSVRNVDARRLAYLLATLIDGPTPGGRFISDPERRPGPHASVEVIFTDEAYIEALRRELGELRRRRWIHDEAYGALGEQGLLRPSPWHVDHVHVRFAGAPAIVSDVLSFAAPKAAPADDGVD
ncbi:MAG: hypothetical protein AAF928_05210 [Myxococcota bacterium]